MVHYVIKQQQPYRTRINFPRLKSRKSLCAVIRKKLRKMPEITTVQVRAATGSVILEHPSTPVNLAIITALVNKDYICAKLTAHQRPVRQKITASCCIGNASQNNTRKNHVTGFSLLLSGLYIIYLFGKQLFATTSTITTIATPIFTLPALVAFALSLPIQLQAVDNLKRTGRPDMGLISTGLLYLSIFSGNVLAALTAFWMFNLANWLEDRIRIRTRQAVRGMLTDRINTAWLVKDDMELEVDANSLESGDIISLRLGNTIPVDGVIVEGSSLINESTMTGEGLAVCKQSGDKVLAGTIIESGNILVKTSKAGEATRLAAIIRLIETAETEAGELQHTSQRFSQIMVPISLTLAAIAFIITGSLLQAMAVLIITCPCVLRLSTSVAVSAAMSCAARQSILIKGGRYLEIAGKVNVLVLDKTGTLTDMTSEVTTVTLVDKRFKADTLLQLAASTQKKWPHPLSRAVTSKAEATGLPLLPCTQTDMVTGYGVKGIVNNKTILVGSRRFMQKNKITRIPNNQSNNFKKISAESRLYVACNGSLIGIIEIQSKVRGNLGQTLKQLRNIGIKHIALLTGDHQTAAIALKEKFHFDEIHWEQSPEDKAAWIKKWQDKHPKDIVAMVGDGINDTPAFAAAHLSFAIAEGGADVTVEYADIVMQPGNIDQLLITLMLGQNTLASIKKSYTMAISLNAATLATTTFGIISPVTGALLHNLITIATVKSADSDLSLAKI